jgi:hypothetical protein
VKEIAMGTTSRSAERGTGSVRWWAWLAWAPLFAVLVAAPGFGLPKGYAEDFEGCRERSKDAADRDRCCSETYDDCEAECKKIRGDAPDDAKSDDEYVKCSSGCAIEANRCQKTE